MDSCLIVIVRLSSEDVQAPQLDWLPDWWTRDWWTTVVPCAARSVLRITATRCIEIGEQERTREDRRDEERESPPPRRAPPRWRDRWDGTRKRKWWGARLRGCALRSAGAASTHRSVIPRCTKKTNDRATTEPRLSYAKTRALYPAYIIRFSRPYPRFSKLIPIQRMFVSLLSEEAKFCTISIDTSVVPIGIITYSFQKKIHIFAERYLNL